MTAKLKTFLICLLMAALPLQGFAAVVKMSCGIDRQHKTQIDAVAVHAHDAAMVQHAGHMLHHTATHEIQLAQQMHGHAALQHAPVEPAHAGHTHQHASCSACAACCFGVPALPSATILLAVQQSSEFAFAFLPQPVAAYIPDGPERPPRSFPALI